MMNDNTKQMREDKEDGSQSSVETIPSEILSEIFSYLSPKQLTESARGVNKFWKAAADTDQFWSQACKKQRIQLGKTEDPKLAFINWYRMFFQGSFFLDLNLSLGQSKSIAQLGKIEFPIFTETYKSIDKNKNFNTLLKKNKTYIFEFKFTNEELSQFEYQKTNYLLNIEAYCLKKISDNFKFEKAFITCHEMVYVNGEQKLALLFDNRKTDLVNEKQKESKEKPTCVLS